MKNPISNDLKEVWSEINSPVIWLALAAIALHEILMRLGWLPAGEWPLKDWIFLPHP